jgi:hypothetical protein
MFEFCDVKNHGNPNYSVPTKISQPSSSIWHQCLLCTLDILKIRCMVEMQARYCDWFKPQSHVNVSKRLITQFASYGNTEKSSLLDSRHNHFSFYKLSSDFRATISCKSDGYISVYDTPYNKTIERLHVRYDFAYESVYDLVHLSL